jgi:hypothetical protein
MNVPLRKLLGCPESFVDDEVKQMIKDAARSREAGI